MLKVRLLFKRNLLILFKRLIIGATAQWPIDLSQCTSQREISGNVTGINSVSKLRNSASGGEWAERRSRELAPLQLDLALLSTHHQLRRRTEAIPHASFHVLLLWNLPIQHASTWHVCILFADCLFGYAQGYLLDWPECVAHCKLPNKLCPAYIWTSALCLTSRHGRFYRNEHFQRKHFMMSTTI